MTFIYCTYFIANAPFPAFSEPLSLDYYQNFIIDDDDNDVLGIHRSISSRKC